YKYKDFFPSHPIYKTKSIPKLADFLIKGCYDFEAEKKLLALIEEIKPDVVHVHDFQALSHSVFVACKKANVPVVFTVHGPDHLCPAESLLTKSGEICHEAHCWKGQFHYSLINGCLEHRKVYPFVFFRFLIRSTLLRMVSKNLHFICPSQAIANLVVLSGKDKSRIHVVNNALANEKFQIEPCYENKGYFLYVGRLEKTKGLHYLIEAMKHVPRNVKLHIVGKGNREEDLKKQASSLGLDNIDFLGFRSGKELEEEYKNCIATILPCNWFENFPTTILESYAYGKPVIASKLGGIPEMIDNGISGILTEPTDINGLANAMNRLLNDKELVVNMGKAGRVKLERLFNPNVHYDKLLNVYKEQLIEH
ncbi:MAG: glycosyltransferase family 4 protein, partial [Candidatus Gastranaerophilales bacterium]|nr:glycosyltransferase family 4 protein [Candidatus Gastranaerophilales bacterium]